MKRRVIFVIIIIILLLFIFQTTILPLYENSLFVLYSIEKVNKNSQVEDVYFATRKANTETFAEEDLKYFYKQTARGQTFYYTFTFSEKIDGEWVERWLYSASEDKLQATYFDKENGGEFIVAAKKKCYFLSTDIVQFEVEVYYDNVLMYRAILKEKT